MKLYEVIHHLCTMAAYKKKTDITKVRNKNSHPTTAPGLQEWTKETGWTPDNGGKR